MIRWRFAQDYPLKDGTVETPMVTAPARMLARDISLVLVLRAGLGMLDGLLELVPWARVGHIGMYRHEATLAPVEYYAKVPDNIAATDVVVVNPLLATGGSAARAVAIVKRAGATNIKFMCIVAAPDGVRTLSAAHPDLPVFAAALDSHLNERGYIVPGLGDAGDRLFGTK